MDSNDYKTNVMFVRTKPSGEYQYLLIVESRWEDCRSRIWLRLRNKDLFTGFNLVFFDTTSIYFEGNGGDGLGQYGYSKDRPSDERQMIVGIERFKAEWDEIRQDIDALYEVEIEHKVERYLLRSSLQGMCGKILKAIGVALLPSVAEVKT